MYGDANATRAGEIGLRPRAKKQAQKKRTGESLNLFWTTRPATRPGTSR
jgi:hypothetical protein